MGTDAERKSITERYLRGGIEGLFEGRIDADAQAAEAQFDVNNQSAAEQGGTTSDTGRAGGDQGTRNRASLASRAQSIARSIEEI